MTSVDELFKKPPAPGQKRKLDAPKDPNELYKSVKVDQNGDARGNLQPTAEDEEEDAAAGPELPPDFEDEGEDEDGRFFGGGVTRDTAQIMDYVDEQDGGVSKAEKIDSSWLRKTALNFEKKISKNAELRAKFEGSPEKFMSSEADLDETVKSLSILSEHPNLYPEFAQLGCLASLVSLLSHENTDVAIDAIQIISELTDEDVSAEQSDWDALVAALIDADLLDLLHANVTRLDESLDTDRTGVYHTLSILESLASNSTQASTISAHAQILPWLLSRSLVKESHVGQNKQYAAEVLAILLQTSSPCVIRFLEVDGVDAYLQALAPYRKREPENGTEEEEWVENLFGCLTLAVDTPAGKNKFLDAEGIELCLLMVREGKLSRPRALRVLDHLLGGTGEEAVKACMRLVEAAGLKPLFTLFMKNKDKESTEHLLGIMACMLRRLPGDSAERIRLLGKFMEREYEKIARLVRLRRDYASRLAGADADIAAERRATVSEEEREEMAPTWLSRRLDAGAFALQSLDTVLAWLVAEDDGARGKIVGLLAERDEDLAVVRRTLEEQLRGLGDGGAESEEEKAEEREVGDMLETLVGFLR